MDEQGRLGLDQVDRLLASTTDLGDRIGFAPRRVCGSKHDTGAIYQVQAQDYSGPIAAGGRYDGHLPALGGPEMPACGGSIDVGRILAAQDAGRSPVS